MKKYREAKTDEEKKRGKSTDELSFKEALNFFKKRGKEKGASKFRWRGDAYNLEGEKLSKSKSSSSKPKSETKSTAPTKSKRPPTKKQTTVDGGPRRQSNKPSKAGAAPTAMTSSPSMSGNNTSASSSPSRPATESAPTVSKSILQNLQNKRKQAQDTLRERKAASERKAEIRASAPTFREFFNQWRSNNPSVTGPDLIEAREKQRMEYEKMYGAAPTRPGMNKGGMVRKGNTNYKGKGMFYKSASPRGYK